MAQTLFKEDNDCNRRVIGIAFNARKKVDEFVMLQVRVRESIRDRLKLQSVMLKESMGDLADRLLDEALNQLEKSGTSKGK